MILRNNCEHHRESICFVIKLRAPLLTKVSLSVKSRWLSKKAKKKEEKMFATLRGTLRTPSEAGDGIVVHQNFPPLKCLTVCTFSLFFLFFFRSLKVPADASSTHTSTNRPLKASTRLCSCALSDLRWSLHAQHMLDIFHILFHSSKSFFVFFFLNFDPRSDEDRWKHFRARETIRRWTLHNKLQSLSWRSVLKQSFRCQNSFSCQVLSGKSKLQTFSGISMEKCYAKRGRARGGRLFVCWLMERSSREFPSTPAFRLLC